MEIESVLIISESFGRVNHFTPSQNFSPPENSLVAVRSELNSAATSQMNCVYHTAESFEMVGSSVEILL